MVVPEWLTNRPIAHRGFFDNKAVPENSAAAFELAISRGHPIEFDIRQSRDRKLAVFHDIFLSRMTGQRWPIAACTWSEIKDLRLIGTEQSIPRLETALELINGRVPVLIEIKNESFSNRMEANVAEVLDGYSGPFAVQSFNPLSVRWFKRHRPEYCCGQLAGGLNSGMAIGRVTNYLLKNIYLNFVPSPHFIAYYALAGDISFFKSIKRLTNAPLILWTVDTQEKLALCRALNVNYIFESHFSKARQPSGCAGF